MVSCSLETQGGSFLPGSDEPQEANFLCAECGTLATRVTYVPAGRSREKLDPVSRRFDSACLIIEEFGVTTWLSEEDATAVGEAVRNADVAGLRQVDQYLTPFWCPSCEQAYCPDHYPSSPTFEDGFYDATFARCPKGHLTKVDD